jgi:hypothetical protein
VVILCHWDYFYTNNEAKRNNYHLCIAKNRQGCTGFCNVDYVPEFYKFKDSQFVVESTPPVAESTIEKIKDAFGAQETQADSF